MDSISQREKRLQFYKRLLEKNPPIYTALCEVLNTVGPLSPDEELYLHVWVPAITEFAEWVLRQAERDGKQRLYFLARDAWPIYLMTKTICAGRRDKPECRYLSVSRYALRLPEYHLLKENCVDRICVGGIGVTLRRILRRGGLDDAAAIRTAEELGLADQIDRELLYHEIQALKMPLQSSEFFFDEVMKHSEAAAPNAIGYLEQEGLLDGISFAVVDSGWIGTQQETLERLLCTRRENQAVDGYYFGLYETPLGVDWKKYHSFYFSPLRGLWRKVQFSNCLFETVCSAPEGMTLGYQKRGQLYEPVTGKPNPNAERISRYAYLASCFARIYSRLTADAVTYQQNPCCNVLLKALMSRPQKWEAEAFGNLTFSDDMLEQSAKPVAVRMTDRDLRDLRVLRHLLLMLGVRKGKPQESAWIEGSIVCANGKSELIHAALYKLLLYLRKAGKCLCARITNWNGLNSICL